MNASCACVPRINVAAINGSAVEQGESIAPRRAAPAGATCARSAAGAKSLIATAAVAAYATPLSAAARSVVVVPMFIIGLGAWASDARPNTGADHAAEVRAAARSAPAARAMVMCMPNAAYVTASETGDAAAA